MKTGLATIPSDPRGRELWLQHLAGFILFQDVRDYAREQIPKDATPAQQRAAEEAIDNTLYGLMMVADGVTGQVVNEQHGVRVRLRVELVERESKRIVESLDLFDGDGACMGFHGWLEGDFGDKPILQ